MGNEPVVVQIIRQICDLREPLAFHNDKRTDHGFLWKAPPPGCRSGQREVQTAEKLVVEVCGSLGCEQRDILNDFLPVDSGQPLSGWCVSQIHFTRMGRRFLYQWSDFRFQPWPGTIAITTLLEFCSWQNYKGKGGEYMTGVYYGSDLNSTSGYKYVGLNGNMSSVKLVTFAACLTASNNDNNITARAVSYGAKTAVGWSSSINSGSHSNWLARYNDKLATGSTVLEAVTYANSFTYLDSDVKDARIYGNRSLKIKLTKMASKLDEEAALENIRVSVSHITGIVNEASVVEAAYKNIPEFYSGDYDVEIHEICKDCYTVDFVFTVDGIRTNSGYTMTIIDGRIASITDNTIDFNKDEVKTVAAQFRAGSDIAIMRAAKEKTNSSVLKNATDQEIVYFYDIESGTFKKIVFTTYQFDGTDAVGKDMYIQNIS